jgi:hypothetical protein
MAGNFDEPMGLSSGQEALLPEDTKEQLKAGLLNNDLTLTNRGVGILLQHLQVLYGDVLTQAAAKINNK